MAKGEQRGNREAKKPTREKPKTRAAAPSAKGTAGSSSGSKKQWRFGSARLLPGIGPSFWPIRIMSRRALNALVERAAWLR